MEGNFKTPYSLRLGLLKPHLDRMAFDDVHSKSTHDFIVKHLKTLVLNDAERGPLYLKEIEESKKQKL